MKLKKSFLIILLFLGLIILTNNSYAGYQEWNSLDYDVILNQDGSASIVETWDVYVSQTNTLFKDFDLDLQKFSGITDVMVYKVNGSEDVPLKQVFEEQYHVDKGCFYGLNINPNKFEIAWHVGLDDSSEIVKYKISYKVLDAVQVYNDCTEFYWMFLSTENTMEGDNITGRIRLPQNVSNDEKLRVWAHGPLTGVINKSGTNEAVFSVPSIDKNEMLEVRIVTEENIFEGSQNIREYEKLEKILAEEKEYAEEANRKREMINKLITALSSVLSGICIFILYKISKIIRDGKSIKKEIENEIQYFRDIPDEKNSTPAKAAYLYYFKKDKTNMDVHISKVFSATILNLSLKKLIEFEPIDKKNVKIILKEKNEILSKDEECIWSLLKSAANNSSQLTTKELEKYCKKEYDAVYSKSKELINYAKLYSKEEKIIDSEKETLLRKWHSRKNLYVVLAVLAFFNLFFFITFPRIIIGLNLTIFSESILAVIICNIISNKINIFSEYGKELRSKWCGLKRYMEKFSLLKDKEVPDLILWEKYLVYATTFGISKKVIEQLKIVYPEFLDANTYNGKGYSYMYFAANPNYGMNFMSSLDDSLSKSYKSAISAYNTAHSSSSGGGGGFSGGGGGGRRWPEAVAEDRKQKKVHF